MERSKKWQSEKYCVTIPSGKICVQVFLVLPVLCQMWLLVLKPIVRDSSLTMGFPPYITVCLMRSVTIFMHFTFVAGILSRKITFYSLSEVT